MNFKAAFLMSALFLAATLIYASQEPEERMAAENSDDSWGMSPDRGYIGCLFRYEDGERQGRIRILEVFPESPAERTGLQKNDLIVAVNGVPFRFENDLDMIRGFDWVRAGDKIVLSVVRGDNELTVALLTSKMPSDRAHALSQWIRAAKVWYEGGGCETCRQRQAQQRAIELFQQEVTEEGVVLVISRESSTKEIIFKAEEVTVPPGLDLSKVPVLTAIIEALQPGDSMQLRLSRSASTGGLMIQPLGVLPPYLERLMPDAVIPSPP